MHTDIPTATTNLFQVKDIAEFTSMIGEYPDVQVQLFEDNYVSLQTKHPIWPLSNPNDKDIDNHSYEDHHFAHRIAEHLTEESYVILTEFWPFGNAVAMNHRKEYTTINLLSIYEQAKEKFGFPSPQYKKRIH